MKYVYHLFDYLGSNMYNKTIVIIYLAVISAVTDNNSIYLKCM